MTQPPLRLRNAARDGWLTLEWADGTVSRIDHARLRAACPCAQCRAQRLRGRIDAAEQGVRLRGRIDAAEQGVRLRDIRLQGYGVQLVFDDGHERGIYPWSYLRDEL
ncbi:gamma-butyrobetaine hydroxylase-like domain-containing protein [Pseudomonas aeruginosa]|uniref:DUF971 domain-containing protein n=1 Tax=Pseudomonas aeruginosa TaxID=287 RepID=UPI00115202A9|nr:gamma-butyrobetaine hydroxylase-like domain-containing protein [Pseudomonas aeruginosa]TQG11465.1 DUF971 domain-containing protein [Pseudomonas aeruginosa]